MTTWTNQPKQTGANSFLLKEDGFYLLLETGDKIILALGGTDWSTQSKNSATFTTLTKS